MLRPPPRSTQAFTLFPYTTLFRSQPARVARLAILGRMPRVRLPFYYGWLLRSEEHTSELQSRPLNSYAVFCLKKKIHPRHCRTKNGRGKPVRRTARGTEA